MGGAATNDLYVMTRTLKKRSVELKNV
jgi:hypothetical protein